MNHPYYLQKNAEIRHKELIEAARLAQRIREIEANKARFWQRLTWKASNWLISLGPRLGPKPELTEAWPKLAHERQGEADVTRQQSSSC
jgi:hypothetical protein